MNSKSFILSVICFAGLADGNTFGQSISGFFPSYGSVGEMVRIEGSGFTGVTGVKFFNNKSASFSVTSDTQINAVVPSGAVTGAIIVMKGANTATSADDYIVIGPGPYVTDFSPVSGSGGTEVTLNGVHFTGVNVVKFNGTNGFITQLTSDTQIKITPQAGFSTGPISLTRPGAPTFTTSSNFFAAASIASFSPGSGRLGTNVVITGKNFIGATAVRFNGVAAPSFSVDSNTQITLALWSGAATGLINIIAPGGQAFSSSNFVVLPTFLSFSPLFGKPGTNVTINGANFLGNPIVKFNGATATIVGTPTANQIVATVPAAATSGPITVTTTNGVATSAMNFFLPPGITLFTPNFGASGTSVTITGVNFTNATDVSFNGASSSFGVVNNTTITSIVPASATSGLISVTAPGGTAVASVNFFVPPIVSGFNPASGIAGNSVTITGSSFTNATMVKFNGVNATNFTVINNSQLTAIVPANATTGPVSVIAPGGTGTSAANFLIDVLSVAVKKLANSAVALSWPSSATGFALQANTNLSSTNWVAVTNVPVVVNGKNTVTNSITNSTAFYRLRK